MNLTRITQLAPPFTFAASSLIPAYPYAEVVLSVKGGAVAVVARIPSNVICHTAGKSAPAVCTAPRLGMIDGAGA